MQLEEPGTRWLHVGGSGDGGADGLGLRNGKTVKVLQCKWKYSGRLDELADWLGSSNVSVVVASLVYDELPDDRRILGRDWLVDRILRHSARPPEALSLGIKGDQ